jgi:NAD-dependent dihydropyrimidine dehydrogenase PreA subunit
MEMQVNAELCTGCGACVEICSNEAIQLSEGLPVFDQVACTQCQSCVDACPVDAITAIELSLAITNPTTVQSLTQREIVVPETVPLRPKPWLSTVLVFAGREILPRLADALFTALDRRLAQTQLAQPHASVSTRNTEMSSGQNSGQSYRQRRRFGLNRQRDRRRGRKAGKRH